MKARNHKEFTDLLYKNGFLLNRVKGSHEIWKRESDGATIAVPHSNVNFMIQHRLIKGYKLKEA